MSFSALMGGVELVEDYKRYKSIHKCGFMKLFIAYPEFRYQLYYRLRCNSKILKILLLPLKLSKGLNLYIHCKDIEGGLYIEHGFATIITCSHIGKNCWINQQVTIGNSDASHCPYIGDNVSIKAGAKIIGDVTIGNDVIVGANAVVVKDVPDHSIVAGVPARVIKTRNSVDEPWVRVK